jgi:hypothetical protein
LKGLARGQGWIGGRKSVRIMTVNIGDFVKAKGNLCGDGYIFPEGSIGIIRGKTTCPLALRDGDTVRIPLIEVEFDEHSGLWHPDCVTTISREEAVARRLNKVPAFKRKRKR